MILPSEIFSKHQKDQRENADSSPYTTCDQFLTLANAYGSLANEIYESVLTIVCMSAISMGGKVIEQSQLRTMLNPLWKKEHELRQHAFTLPWRKDEERRLGCPIGWTFVETLTPQATDGFLDRA
jgi:hypothetical protein